MRYYEALGLAPSLIVDAADLKRRFYDQSRQWHPDRFSRATAAEQEKALEMTAVLNDAFRTLRDPVARAEYFLKEQGLEVSKEAPPELLEEVFELNMALEELREGDESARGQLVQAQSKFAAMLTETDAELIDLFTRYDDGPSPDTLDEVRGILNRRRYISNLVRDVEKELNVHSAN
ncbi:MAG: Fe-S protein assembly co-chaperone HscB [Acidobacteriota bacterium]